MSAAQKLEVEQPFEPAERAFSTLTKTLSTPKALELNHSALEDLIQTEGREILRLLFQGHLELRGPGDVGPSVVGSDGVERSKKRTTSRRLASVFGLVMIARVIYGWRGGGVTGLAPMDASLNLPKDLYSHGIRRRVASLSTRMSFDQVVAEIGETTGTKVPKRQVEELAQRAAIDFDEFYAERENIDDTPGEILVITVDGKGIVMRPGSLRDVTRKAAERSRGGKLRKRLTKGEKRNRKRMATVAAVYTIDRDIRTAEDIVSGLQGPDSKPRKRPKPHNKRVWASVEKGPKFVIQQAFEEALRRDPKRQKQWVALVDGNKTQINLLKEAAKAHGVKLTIILDVIHVTEYLWKAARVLYTDTDPAGEAWVDERLLRLLQGKCSGVAGGMRRSATKRGLEMATRKNIDKAAAYLLKYKAHIQYQDYLSDGLPIATGVIEGACRYLVKDRMDITGARWGLKGAEAVLRLRALMASDDFEAYWRFHESRERSSNHDVFYKDSQPPETTTSFRAVFPRLRLVS